MTVNDVYSEWAKRHGYPESARYRRVLEAVMTPEEARIGLELPAPPEEADLEQIAAKLNLQVGAVQAALESLFRKGILSAKDFKTRRGLRMSRSAFHAFMGTQSTVNPGPNGPAVFKAWHDFVTNEFYADLAKVFGAAEKPLARVMPYIGAVKDNPELLPNEDIRVLFREASPIAVANCSCRQCFAGGGDPCKRTTDNKVCLNFGRASLFLLERGAAEQITPEQAMAIVARAEENGLVHCWDIPNIVMCNCCNDCCVAIKPCHDHNVDIKLSLNPSRFGAASDPETCIGCGTCEDRCLFGAIHMEPRTDGDGEQAVVDGEKCMGCGMCTVTCPSGALSLNLVRPAQFIEDAEPYEKWLKKIKA
jgi:ferredoxin